MRRVKNRYKKSLRDRIPRMHASLVDTVAPNLTTNLELRKDEDHLIATVHPINSVRSILFHFHYILPLSCRRTNVTLVEFTADDSVMHKNTQFHILTRPKSKKTNSLFQYKYVLRIALVVHLQSSPPRAFFFYVLLSRLRPRAFALARRSCRCWGWIYKIVARCHHPARTN